ncbi:ankyrin repeat domain-containing protein [Mesorhizobium sp.]|uniref:ankyrin repeat domain-containing protein n=1 Tax=Mesorhizobium sp. TaxID=1871066 RepID=UPI002616B56A|nr:ankyrin repeat domain-containing protein [Mesorhizobium sp.]
MRMFLLFILLLVPVPTASYAGAIHDAAKEGDVAAITAALDAGAGVNESDESDVRMTPLYLAVRGGHFAAAKLLIERGADVNAAPTPLLGPALMPALAKRRIDLINLLLGGGADPNSHSNRENALHLAGTLGCLDCVKALVEAGADVNAKTMNGKTPLHLAKSRGQREIADYLLSHGVVLPTPAPISMKLASADVEKGRTTFTRLCAGCHNHEPQGGNKTGPNFVERRRPRQGIYGKYALLRHLAGLGGCMDVRGPEQISLRAHAHHAGR